MEASKEQNGGTRRGGLSQYTETPGYYYAKSAVKLKYDHSNSLGVGALPIVRYTGRLRPKGVPFLSSQYTKGQEHCYFSL